MSAFNDPRLLRESTATFDDALPITEDRHCRGCGYNLKGLSYGGVCPECGRTISGAVRRKSGHLGRAPAAYLRRLQFALFTCGVPGLLAVIIGAMALTSAAIRFGVQVWTLLVAPVPGAATGARVASTFAEYWAVPLGLLAALLWCAGLAFLLVRRPNEAAGRKKDDAAPEWPLLRKAVAITQACWIPIPIIAGLEMSIPGKGIAYALIPFALAATFGMGPVAILLSRFAFWASDDGLARRLQGCAWGTLVLGAIFVTVAVLAIAGVGAAKFVAVFSWIIVACWFLSIALVPLFALKLASSVRWAMINTEEEHRRDERMAERARRMRDEGAMSAPPAGAVPIDEQLLERVEARHREMEAEAPRPDAMPPIGKSHQRVIGPTETDPYSLEDPPQAPPNAPRDA